jgi:glycosyltransferase involved in cell wall biosynthesis
MIHSFYSAAQPSGENAVVESEVSALRRAGHEVALITERSNERIVSPLYPVAAALRVATGRGRSPLRRIEAFAPDVIHVHNLFPNFGRRWAMDLHSPLVATVHNYRPLCVSANLFRDGRVCTRCPDGDRFAGVRYGCYRGSRAASIPQAWANRRGLRGDPLLARADKVVVLSQLAAEVYARAGLEQARMVVSPNFVPDDLDPGPPLKDTSREGWLYVGRFSPDKGIVRLLEMWPAHRYLRVVGAGTEEREVARIARGRVEVLGGRDRAEVLELMRSSVGLVFPSLWFEAFPVVYAEALAAGLPVLAWEPSVVARLVAEDRTGWVTGWGDDLDRTLTEAEERFPSLQKDCRRRFEQRYSEAAYLARAGELYGSLTEKQNEP